MKHFFRKYEKYFSLHHYIAVMRRQPAHMRHVYAAIFAGGCTCILAATILYFDYGFWHERYSRSDTLEVTEVKNINDSQISVLSPGAMISDFFKEAIVKLGTIDLSRKNLLEGKDIYIKEAATSSSK